MLQFMGRLEQQEVFILKQRRLFLGIDIQRSANAGVTDVPVDQQDLFAKLRQRNGKVRRHGGFAFAGGGAGDQNRFFVG